MALVIPADCAQVTIPLVHNLVQRPAAITFGVQNVVVAGATPATADAILTAFSSAINLDSNVVAGPARMTLAASGGGTGTVEGTFTLPGGNTSTTTSPAVALLAKKVTGRLGRRGRGRMFIPWYIDAGSVGESGTISPTTLAAVALTLQDFLDNLDGINLPMVLLHDSDGVTPAGAPDEVTALVPDARVGTQRRRQRG